MEKKISIIIPCHNCADSLGMTWDSIKNQSMSLEYLECIFVDDASDDGGATVNKLEAIENEASESVLLIKLDKNVRQGGARNAGLQYASGEYIIFLDADDTLRKDTCDSLYNKAEKFGCDLIQFKHRHIKENDNLKGIPETGIITGKETLYELADNEVNRKKLLTLSIGSAGCTNKFYKTQLIRTCSSWYAEGVIYEEPKFVYPLFLFANKILMLDEDYYEYHWRQDSTMTSQLGKRLLEHPRVQLELLEDLMAKTDLYNRYHDEIEYYFIKSFYLETLVFAYTNRGIIPLEYMSNMQNVCKEFFPKASSNKYITNDQVLMKTVASLDKEFDNMSDLQMFEKELTKLVL